MAHSLEDRARLNIRMAMAERKDTQERLAVRLARRDARISSRQAVNQLLNPQGRYRFNRALAELIRQEYDYPRPWPFPSGVAHESLATYNEAVTNLPSVLNGAPPVELPMPVVSTSLRAFVVQTPDLYPVIVPGDILLVAPTPKAQLACLNLLQPRNEPPVVRLVEYDGDHWVAVNPLRPEAVPLVADTWDALGVIVGHMGQRKGEKFSRLNPTGLDLPKTS